MGGNSSQYSLTSRQNSSTFSAGLARLPAPTFLRLSTLVNTTVTGTPASPSQSRHSKSKRCGFTVLSIKSNTVMSDSRLIKYSRVNAAHFSRKSSGAFAYP